MFLICTRAPKTEVSWQCTAALREIHSLDSLMLSWSGLKVYTRNPFHAINTFVLSTHYKEMLDPTSNLETSGPSIDWKCFQGFKTPIVLYYSFRGIMPYNHFPIFHCFPLHSSSYFLILYLGFKGSCHLSLVPTIISPSLRKCALKIRLFRDS